MAENENVCRRSSINLKKVFDFEIEGALARSLSRITSSGYNLSFLGVGGGVENESEQIEFDFVRANEAMRKFVFDHIDNSEYYIIFDELDEDYRDVLNPDRRDGYFELLISLFKAVQNVRTDFRSASANVRPVIFLRDDIFDLCRDVDKNKWLDRAVTLKWDVNQLRQLLNFRLSRAVDEDADVTEAVWDEVFSVRTTKFGSAKRGGVETFKYLTSRTFLRPRDIISYVRECARVAVSNENSRIGNSEIKDAVDGHSAYMRREVIDELFPVLDDVSEVLDVLSRIRKQIFTRKEFNDRYREFVNSTPHRGKRLSETQVLKLLYHFNVIGNITTANHRVFAYDSAVKVLNPDENLCVHNGLIQSLKIL